MHRLSVVEKKTGCCLYDHIWKWTKEQQTPGAIASLIHFFYQFAAEVDTGEVTKVVFKENPNDGVSKVSSKQRFSNLNLSIGKFNRSAVRRRSQAFTQRPIRSIAMYSAVSDTVVLALFVQGDFKHNPEELARILLDSFMKLHATTVNKHIPRLLELASKTPEAALLSTSFLDDFKSFDEIATSLIEKHCPPENTSSASSTSSSTSSSSSSSGSLANKTVLELGSQSISTTSASLTAVDSSSQLLLSQNSNLSSSGPGVAASAANGGTAGTLLTSSTSSSNASSPASLRSQHTPLSPLSRPSLWEAPRLSVSGLKESRIEVKENHSTAASAADT